MIRQCRGSVLFLQEFHDRDKLENGAGPAVVEHQGDSVLLLTEQREEVDFIRRALKVYTREVSGKRPNLAFRLAPALV